MQERKGTQGDLYKFVRSCKMEAGLYGDLF